MASPTVGTPVNINTFGLPNTTFPQEKPGEFFSYCTGDVLSMLGRPMSMLGRWIPSERTTEMKKTVGHLSFLVGEDFDGSESYMEYITVADPPSMCDFGGTGVEYDICEYEHFAKRVAISNQDRPLNFFSSGGIRYCDNQPRTIVRGEMAGLRIDNDRDWILSALMYRLKTHLEWNKYWGRDAHTTDPGSYEGLRAILTKGWVKDHKIGQGNCYWTDPLVFSGLTLDTPEKLARKIRFFARKIIKRMVDRGYMPSPEDMCIAMPLGLWNLVADYLATGALANISGQTVVQFQTTPEVWQRQREYLTSGGLGYGVFPIDNMLIPIVPDDQLGRTTLAPSGNAAITGDVCILTRYFDGNTILQHRWIDYNAAVGIPELTNYMIGQDGMLRTTWTELNGSCYWYGVEGWFRYESLMQPLQARISDVTLETDDEYEIESTDWTHQDYYPFEGTMPYDGSALLEVYDAW